MAVLRREEDFLFDEEIHGEFEFDYWFYIQFLCPKAIEIQVNLVDFVR